MKRKMKLKIIIDVLMTIGLFFVSGYQFWGEAPHEWVGTGMFIMFIAHHILNLNWYKGITKGKHSVTRIFQLSINIALLLVMIMEMYSGIVMSRYVFDFLSIGNGLALARKLHILGAYWGFILMSIHLGMHWNMIVKIVQNRNIIKGKSKLHSSNIRRFCGVLIFGYGLYAFVHRNFLTYLFLKSEFVFLDYSEFPMWFYIDYWAVMGCCIFICYYLKKYVSLNR